MGVSLKTGAFVDLHVHTTCSDGTLTPEEVVQKAAEEGVQILAITDHDEVEGIQRAKQEAKKHNIQIIPGIECSTDFKGGNLHILGYNINPNNKALKQFITRCQLGRVDKVLRTLELLEKLGMPLSYHDVEKYSPAGAIGRPHIAQAMIEKGYVSSKDEAFDKYIGKGKPAYAAGRKTTPEEAIKVIKKAKGIPILAHPYQMNLSSIEETLKKIESLIAVGLQGVEAIYPEHTQEQTYQLIRFANIHGLFVTAGSDFHGDNKVNKLGYCLGNKEKLTLNTCGILGRIII